ncbi:MAG: DUF2953 domain-containing protein [Methanothrix sp.]|nr:DUF2953 domain-containing protein [Methanothrix sp.]
MIILAIILLAPFNLSLNIGKKGPLVWGSIKLAWLGIALRMVEISPQSADDFLASIGKEDAGNEERAVDKNKTTEKKNEPGGKKDREQDEKEIDRKREGRERSETTNAIHHPSVSSLVDAAPPLTKILWDLLKSIRFKNSFCCLCFGLDDPAQTAVISGYLWFLASALGTFSANISINPWFEGERLEGELIAEIEARLLFPVIAVFKAMRISEIRLLFKEMLGWT